MHSEGSLEEGGRRVREGNMMTQAEGGTERYWGRSVGGDLKMPSTDFENGGRGHQPRNASGLSGPFTTAATGNSYRGLLILKVIKSAHRKPQIYIHVHIYICVCVHGHAYVHQALHHIGMHTAPQRPASVSPPFCADCENDCCGCCHSNRASLWTYTSLCYRCLLTALRSLCLTELKTLLWVLETLRLIPVHFSFTLGL